MNEEGFEYKLPGDEDATFFPWALTDGAKDMLLIDRIAGVAVHEFFAMVEEGFTRRGSSLLTMIATSIRAKFPDWTPERIVRVVMNLNLSDIEFVGGEEDDAGPPAEGGQANDDNSGKPSAESKPSATRKATTPSATSAGTPA